MSKQDTETLVINRARWARGGNVMNTQLLDKEGMMCCLGFLALHMGHERIEILGKAEPGEVVVYDDTLESHMGSEFVGKAMLWNDDASILDDLREEGLQNLFRKENIDLQFV